MSETRSIYYPVVFTPAEMAVLLSLAGAQTLLGLESKGLFPTNGSRSTWDQTFLQGRAQLERERWLDHLPGTVQYRLNEELGMAAAVMAAPQFVLVTNLDWPGQPRQSVTHYLAAAVVEASFDGQDYHMAALRSIDIMLARQATAMQLPAQPPPWLEFELSNEQARQAVADPQPRRLGQWGVSASSAAAFAHALRPGQARASVQVMSVVYGRVEAVHRVRVLYADPAGAATGEYAAWLAAPVAGSRVRLIPASAGRLVETVRTLLPHP
ncbi:MAG: hypothetical protein IAE85_21185 [Anaerolinea sp.]|nr:hypothetical protein [Anaerolinea sp.]